jgi:selenoprotein W-related protein
MSGAGYRKRGELRRRRAVATGENPPVTHDGGGPRLEIKYCTQCRWLLRAAWMAQELLTTFQAELGEVALVPTTGGVFRVSIDGDQIWDRAGQGGFPELSELKQLVRDKVAPERDLGHSDRKVQR